MDKNAFMEKYAITDEMLDRLSISWDDLMDIYEDYDKKIHEYEVVTSNIAVALNKEKSIHSIKYRIKDKEHLIEKIIRKSVADPSFVITTGNYMKLVKDLIGLRALHLFKENWVDIHRFLADNWEFYTTPRANYKKGDPHELLDMYSDFGCVLNEHRHGYRSVHYHLLIRQGNREMVAEVQVRTLFEEAWSEIDHYFRYSAKSDAEQAEPYLGLLNNITSNADALASYINRMDTLIKAAESGLKEKARLNVKDMYKKVRNG